MKGLVFDIKRYAIHDGPGIRTTVFLKGCPLNCWWCHNPESCVLAPEKMPDALNRACWDLPNRQEKDLLGREVSENEIMPVIEKDVAYFDESGGGVTFSGGEPLMQPDFLFALLSRCKEREIHTAIDTSGYADWKIFKKILPLTDLFLYDLKLMDDELHLRYTGVSNKIILSNLKNLSRMKKNSIIRVPAIPGITDTPENLNSVIHFIRSLGNIQRVDLLPYNPIGEEKYRRFQKKFQLGNLTTQSENEMQSLKRRFELSGFQTTIGG